MLRILILLGSLLSLAACSQPTTDAQELKSNTTYRKEKTGALHWQAPDGWVQETPMSSMRKAQYSVPRVKGDPEDASIVIFYFQGNGGGGEANIQRWTNQFTPHQGRLSKNPAIVKSTIVNKLNQTVIDISGTYQFKMTPAQSTSIPKPDFRMIAAVIESSSGPWFVKFVGPRKTIDKWQESFYKFLKTLME